MRISNVAGYALSTSIALTTLAGCSGGAWQVAPTPLGQVSGAGTDSIQRQVVQGGRINRILGLHGGIVPSRPAKTPTFMSPDAMGQPLIFLSDVTNRAVDIYLQADKHQKMVGQVTGLNPSGVASDSAGNLYVGNYTSSGASNIPVYAPPYTGPPKSTLDDAGYFSVGVAVSPTGIVAAANQCDAPNCTTTGNIKFYAKNATMPCATVADPANFPHPVWDAFDDKENLYVEGFTSTGSVVIGEVKGACQATKILLLNLTNAPSLSGIQVDKMDRIALLTTGTTTYDVLDIYRAPKNGSFGKPVSSSHLAIANSVFAPIDFAFSASNADVYTEDGGSVVLMDKYDLPAGGNPEKTITGGWAAVAVTPPSIP